MRLLPIGIAHPVYLFARIVIVDIEAKLEGPRKVPLAQTVPTEARKVLHEFAKGVGLCLQHRVQGWVGRGIPSTEWFPLQPHDADVRRVQGQPTWTCSGKVDMLAAAGPRRRTGPASACLQRRYATPLASGDHRSLLHVPTGASLCPSPAPASMGPDTRRIAALSGAEWRGAGR
eukprot:scaffold1811_cov411-Prasinococcus_capsulatus_cf.AAC.12